MKSIKLIIKVFLDAEMPIPHSLGKYFSTPCDIEVVKQYTDWDTFRALYVKIKYYNKTIQ